MTRDTFDMFEKSERDDRGRFGDKEMQPRPVRIVCPPDKHESKKDG